MNINNFAIIIPSKDELDNLYNIIPKIRKLYKNKILIIDKSSEEEFNKINEFIKNYENIVLFKQVSSGKGNALREAVKLCNEDLIIFFDADGSHNPNDIPLLLKPFSINKNIDHVGGSRMLGGSDELYSDLQHYFRLFGSLVINYFINMKFNVDITDYQNGFRAIKNNVFSKLETTSIHTSIEQEMVAKTLSKGFNYTEMPTHEWKRRSGYSKIKLSKHSIDYIISLIKILFYKKENSLIKISRFYSNWYD
tara:strand:+ start:1331 stop:2083 length:753 start_codon:yes stop_codon:yes gene_type:complete